MKEENKMGEVKLELQRLSAARTATNEMEARDSYVYRTEYEVRPCGAEHENARKPAKPDTKPPRSRLPTACKMVGKTTNRRR